MKYIIAIILANFCLISCASRPSAESNKNKQSQASYAGGLEVSVTATNSGRTIRFVLRNEGTKDFRCYKADLPWFSNYGLVLAVVPNDAIGLALRPIIRFRSVLPGFVTIPVGSSIEGTVDLSYRFS